MNLQLSPCLACPVACHLDYARIVQMDYVKNSLIATDRLTNTDKTLVSIRVALGTQLGSRVGLLDLATRQLRILGVEQRSITGSFGTTAGRPEIKAFSVSRVNPKIATKWRQSQRLG